MPVTKINFVPLALNSVQLEGYAAAEFLKIDPLASYTPLTSANVTSLMDIIAGTSTQYLKPTSTFAGDVSGVYTATSVDKIKGISVVGTPTTGQVLKFNGTNYVPAADDTGGSPGDSSYSVKGVVQINTDLATSGLFISSGVLSLPNVVTAGGPTGGAQSVPVITYDQKGRLTAVSTATIDDTTKLPLSGGTMTGGLNMGSQNITNATSIAATNFSGRNLVLNDNDTNTITLKAPTDVTPSNYSLTLPATAGSAGYVLSTDGSGNLSWISASSGSVTSLSSANSYLTITSPTSTPVLTVNVGTVANTVAAGDDARIVGAVQQTAYAADVAPAASCTTSQTPYWSTVADTWLCQNINVSSAGGFFKDGGNSFGAAASLGTNDNFDLNIKTNNTTKMTVLAGGNVGIGTTTPQGKMDITGSSTITSGNSYGLKNYQSIDNTATSSATNYANYNSVDYNSTFAGGSVYASFNHARNNTTGSLATLYGTFNQAYSSLGSTTTSQYASYNNAIARATVTNSYGSYSQSFTNSSTTTSNAYASYNLVSTGTLGTPTINTAYGTYTSVQRSSGSIGTGYGLYVGPVQATTPYSIYASDSSAPSYFAGNVGIGTTAPNTAVDINGAQSMRGMAAPAVSVAGQGRIYFDSTANKFKVSENNGAYVDLVGGGGGAASSVAASAGSAATPSISFSGDPDTGFFNGTSNNTISIAAGGSSIFDISSSGLVSTTTGGGIVTSANGTAAAPTFSFAGDPGTGWWRPAASTLAASTGGAEAMRIDSTGKVGIGTTTPGAKTHVALDESSSLSAISLMGQIIYRTTGDATGVKGVAVYRSPSASTGTVAGGDFAAATSSTTGSNLTNLIGLNASSTHINTTGVVSNLIGLQSKATMSGTGATATNVMAVSGVVDSTAAGNISDARGGFFQVNNTNQLTVANAYGVYVGGVKGTNKFSLYASDSSAPSYFAGNVGIGTTTPFVPLSIWKDGVNIAGNGYAVATTLNTAATKGLWLGYDSSSTTGIIGANSVATANNLAFWTHNGTTDAERVRITSTGNVGIGTASPASKLDVTTTGAQAGSFVTTGNNIANYAVVGVASGAPVGGINHGGYFAASNAGLGNRAIETGIDTAAGVLNYSIFSASPAQSYFAGNVGIGTVSPSTALDISGGMTYRGVAAASVPAAASQGKIYYDSTANKFKVSENNGAYVDLVGGGGGSSQWTTTSSDIYYSTGKVGVGTTTPSAQLNVKASANGDTLILAQGTGGSNSFKVIDDDGYTQMQVFDNSNNQIFGVNSYPAAGPTMSVDGSHGNTVDSFPGWGGIAQLISVPAVIGNENGLVFTSGGGKGSAITHYVSGLGGPGEGGLKFKTTADSSTPLITRMTIDQNGKVGIGTASPISSLDLSSKTDGVNMPRGTTAQQLGCTASTEGNLRYNSQNKVMEFCDGTAWYGIPKTQPTAPPSAPSGAGYFVMSASTWTGNLGGIAGANAKCLTELSTTHTDWAGYADASSRGLLNSGHISAFLCSDGSGICQNAIPLATYYYAVAGNSSAGGASFTADSSGYGPNDTISWAAANRFSGTYYYWTDRYAGGVGGSSYWSTLYSSADCSSWGSSSNGVTARIGASGSTDSGRWDGGGNQTCDVPQHLICMVNP